jgi:serine/threonine protein kinase
MSASIGEHVRCPAGTVINSRYKVVREIGCGNFAKVYKCIDTSLPSSAYPVAVKVLKRDYAADAAFEKDILKALSKKDDIGRKVVRMIDQFTWMRCPCFTFTLHGVSLRSRKMGVARGNTNMAELKAFTREMMETLRFLHEECKMIHTDLKPENILLDREEIGPDGIGNAWTMADFGSASFYNAAKPDSDLISTRPYRAPEVVLSLPWTPKADMWSMACILFELYHGARLFEVSDDADHLAMFERRLKKLPLAMTRTSKHFARFFDASGKVMRRGAGMGRPAPELTNRHMSEIVRGDVEFLDFLSAMLEMDPKSRMSARDALHHPFLAGGHRAASQPSAADAEMARLATDMRRLSIGNENQNPVYAKPSVPSVPIMAPASARGSAPDSARYGAASKAPLMAPRLNDPTRFGGMGNVNRYGAAPTSARDMPAAGRPSALTPRYY